MQELHVNIQDQTKDYYLETTKDTAFTLRVYLYETVDGEETAFALSDDNTAKFCYFVNSFSTEFTEVDGTVVGGLTYVDFDWTTGDTTEVGRFASSINIYDVDGLPEAYASGQVYFNRNPSTGS